MAALISGLVKAVFFFLKKFFGCCSKDVSVIKNYLRRRVKDAKTPKSRYYK
jgi:hypothetical protein